MGGFYNGIADDNTISHYFWREIFTSEEKRELYNADFLKRLERTGSFLEPYRIFECNYNLANSNNFLEQAMFFDTRVCMPDGMLHRVDMSSMYSSLEVRVPYLDNRMVDFAERLPLNLKIRGGTGKYLFRKAFQQDIPQKILSREKHGLSVPVGKWLKSDLRQFSQERLFDSSIEQFIDKKYLRNMFSRHCSGQIDAGRKLWNILIFSIWMNKVKR